MAPNHTGRLESWKEIAAFIGRDERTAMRWAKQGMPVRRDPSGKRGRVYAFTEEIELWRSGRPANGLEQHPAREGRHRGLLIAGGVAILAGLMLGGLLLSRRVSAAVPVRAELVGQTLRVFDARGLLLWEHAYQTAIGPPEGNQFQNPKTVVTVADLEQNGKPDVLVTRWEVPLGAGSLPSGSLDCFDASGRLLWQYVPEATLRFGSQEYKSPWQIYDVLVSPTASGGHEVYVAVAHYLWWPSFVAQLDPTTGHATMRFVNSGSISRLSWLQNRSGNYMLIGGFNNEFYSGALAVMDLRQPFAVSPQGPDPGYHCTSCAAGQPLEYFLFPHSHLNKIALPPLNFVSEISFAGEVLELAIDESRPPNRSTRMISFSIDLPSQLVPQRFDFDDNHKSVHRRLEAEGKLHHSFEQCPDRLHPDPLRLWTPETGWTLVSVPPAGR
jgi:hypothetical protein